jgi:hypothetical protein
LITCRGAGSSLIPPIREHIESSARSIIREGVEESEEIGK